VTKFIIAFLLALPQFLTAQIFEGKCSFYSDKLHGNETASGEKYDMYAKTAAHLTLPFGTKVRVTNLWNGKSVVVKINDRGPFGGRVIDVSKQAAIELQMVAAGVVDVKCEVITDEKEETEAAKEEPVLEKPVVVEEKITVRGDGTFKINVKSQNDLLGYGVQVGSYSDFLALIKKVEELEKSGFPDIFINTDVVNGKRVFRIVVGNFERREDAELFLLSLKSKGFEGYVAAHQTKG